MNSKIRWGVLSTASIARGRFVPAVQQSQYGQVTAIASRDLDKARKFAQEFQIPRAYGSYDDLIESPDVDAIYVATPNSEHAAWAMRCAEAGKPTLCEKPLASNAAESRQMVEAFASRNVPFSEGFMYRFHPQTERIKAIVQEGGIGELRSIASAFSFVARPDEVAMNKSLAGGSLMDIGCYCVNVMRYMTGEEPLAVIAAAQWGKQSGVDEAISGIFMFPSGVVGHFSSDLRAHTSHMYEIRGSNGRIIADPAFDLTPDSGTIIRYWHDDAYEEISMPPANHFILMTDDFARALLEGRPPRFSPEDAVRNMEAIDRIYAAAGRS